MTDQENKIDGELKFKPITQGLGLNHFSDSIPYSPQVQKIKKPVNFQFPKNVPIPRMEAPKEILQNPIKNTAPVYVPEPGSRTKRSFAYLLDFSLIGIFFNAVLFLAFKINDIAFFSLSRKLLTPLLLPLGLFFTVVYIGYFLIQELTWKTTIGKAIFHLRLESQSSLARMCRIVFFFFSALPLGLGLLWSLFDERKRCWHDVVTNTEVQSNEDL